jgi:hypothetical protein
LLKIEQGQKFVQENYSPKKIAEKWLEVITQGNTNAC